MVTEHSTSPWWTLIMVEKAKMTPGVLFKNRYLVVILKFMHIAFFIKTILKSCEVIEVIAQGIGMFVGIPDL